MRHQNSSNGGRSARTFSSAGRKNRGARRDLRRRRLGLESLEDRRMLSVGPAYWLLPGAQFDAGEHPVAVAVADVNGDGVPDLVTANQWSDNVSVLLGRGDGTFGPQTTFFLDCMGGGA